MYERTITFHSEDSYTPDSPPASTVKINCLSSGSFDIVVIMPDGKEVEFKGAKATLESKGFSSILDGKNTRPTIVSQPPPPAVPASTAPSTMERLHIFSNQHRYTLILPTPSWLLSLGSDILSHSKDLGTIRAPMPSLVVDVKVQPGDRVEKGQVAVVLESMKTETVVRFEVAGVVETVGCKKGEMVEEGGELVRVEADAADGLLLAESGNGAGEVVAGAKAATVEV